MLLFINKLTANEIARDYSLQLTEDFKYIEKIQVTSDVLLCVLPNTPHFLVGDDLNEFQDKYALELVDQEFQDDFINEYEYPLALAGYDAFLQKPTSKFEMESWKISKIKETFKFVVGYSAPRTWKKDQLIQRIIEKQFEVIANKKAKFFPTTDAAQEAPEAPTEQQVNDFWSKGNFKMLATSNRQVDASETSF